MSDRVDALVIFGATGDLAKIETFPALVGLVERDVLNVPVIGVSKRGIGYWRGARWENRSHTATTTCRQRPAPTAAASPALRLPHP
jgi:glucose-6-phosphate 1-dehydrogenase